MTADPLDLAGCSRELDAVLAAIPTPPEIAAGGEADPDRQAPSTPADLEDGDMWDDLDAYDEERDRAMVTGYLYPTHYRRTG